MKYLISGTSGQLGREWVHYLTEHEIPFEAFSSSEMDVTNDQAVAKKIKKIQPDLVINCAAYTDVDEAEKEPEKAFLVNEKGVRNIVKACELFGSKLIHYSTDYVFPGRSSDQKKYPYGYPEQAKTDPMNVYGKSKEAGEKILQQAGCAWMLIRVSWLCGRFGNNFVKTMIRLGSERNELRVVDDQIGSPSLAFDVVNKTDHLIHENEQGIFHISCDGTVTWADIAEEIFKKTKRNVNLHRISSEEYPFIAKRPMFSLLSKEKIRKIGLNPLSWKSGLEQLLNQIDDVQNEDQITI